MLYYLKNGKFKLTNWQSAEKLREATGVDEVNEPEKLNKELAKGNHVYCWISPYKAEIDDYLMIYWGLDAEKEIDAYHQSQDEI